MPAHLQAGASSIPQQFTFQHNILNSENGIVNGAVFTMKLNFMNKSRFSEA